jgi:hypothetical protein
MQPKYKINSAQKWAQEILGKKYGQKKSEGEALGFFDLKKFQI